MPVGEQGLRKQLYPPTVRPHSEVTVARNHHMQPFPLATYPLLMHVTQDPSAMPDPCRLPRRGKILDRGSGDPQSYADMFDLARGEAYLHPDGTSLSGGSDQSLFGRPSKGGPSSACPIPDSPATSVSSLTINFVTAVIFRRPIRATWASCRRCRRWGCSPKWR